jgi:DNA-binding SARP family transcriptional activator/tetratricopeptide (TPR) repeat protein
MRYRLLGPLSVAADDGAQIAVVRPKLRLLLAALLASANGVVSADRLVDVLWIGSPPKSARQNLKTYVWALRTLLGPTAPENAPIITGRHGYGISVQPGTLDVDTFERLVTDGYEAHRNGDMSLATKHLEEALALWRGPAFDDIPDTGEVIAAEKDRLEELRLGAVERVTEAWIAGGKHAQAVAELRKWVAQEPFRERLWELLMLALYRSGAPALALSAYGRVRSVLVEEVGVEPSQRLQALQLRILNGDTTLLDNSDSVGDRLVDRNAVAPPKPRQDGCADADLSPDADTFTGVQSPTPRQLPAPPYLFTGRRRELAVLTHALATPVDGAVAVSTIVGAPGVGKTWLALRWAHDNLARFPDGQLYVNLRGFDVSEPPISAKTAVRSFLDALGVPAAAVPATLEGQVGLYRSLLFGKRALILLDNARDAEQVRPLLPSHPSCAVIVTSRDRLTGLITTEGAQPVTLQLLSSEEAREMLARRIGGERMAAEPQAIRDVIELCARLPLALAMVAAQVVSRSDVSVATIVCELRDSHTRLDALGLGGIGDIRGVFSCSYDTLDHDAARMFRFLALHPGPEISLSAAASLAGVHSHRALVMLAELTSANLAMEARYGRYTFHDLLRAYASELADEHDGAEEQELARRRMLDHYVHSAHQAYLRFGPHQRPLSLPGPDQNAHLKPDPDVTPEAVPDQEEAVKWFAREQTALVAVVDLAADTGHYHHALQLAVSLDGFFRQSGHWQDWLATKHVALKAAERLADRQAEALVHCRFAETYAWIGQHREIGAHLRRADDLYQELGDTRGQAYVHLCQGWVYEPRREFQEALDHAKKSLMLYRAVGDARGCADALNNVGWYYAQLGDYRRAIACCERALAEQRRVGTPPWEARTWMSIGFAYHRLGDHRKAAHCYESALRLVCGGNERYYEVRILAYLGEIYQAAANPAAAAGARQKATEVLRQLHHPHPERLDDPVPGLYLFATGRA